MIVLNVKLDGIYGFKDFNIDLSYPKKIVNSLIENEHLKDRERFRYKKIVLLMGSNATGKTILGKALLHIFNFLEFGNTYYLYDMLPNDEGSFTIDFVNDDYRLQRLSAKLNKRKKEVNLKYLYCDIEKLDSYEMCVAKLADHSKEIQNDYVKLSKIVGNLKYRFAYPEIEQNFKLTKDNKALCGDTLRCVLGTLDPSLEEIKLSRDIKDTFIIRRDGITIIVQNGKILNKEFLSSGTIEGIDVSMFLYSLIAKEETFYYCDEHFSYIHSEIEKRIFGIMADNIGDNQQLIFTTHNSDMLDLNLPKHSFMFLRKYKDGDVFKIEAISASSILKRNTDSLRNAVENDVFLTLPQDSLLDELERIIDDKK